MTFLVLLVVLFVSFFIYKQTRSYVYAVIAFLLGMLVVPFIIDQVRLLVHTDDVANGNTGVSTTTSNPSASYQAKATSCACN